jgi:hypothetical protein
MDFKSLLSQLDQLNEATEKTKTGLKHTAEPGGYGRKDDEDDEGNKVKSDAPKKGKGRPKKDADASGETKKYDFSAFGVKAGKDVKLPKYDKKKSTVVKGKSQSHAANKVDDGTDPGEDKTKKKSSLKEYFDQLDKALNEEGYSTAPMPGAVAVKDATGKVVATAKNPQAAAAFEKGDITIGGEEMKEGELDEMWGNPYDDDKVDAINAANPPKAPSGQPNRMTPKPAVHHTYDRKAVASNISGKDSMAYDQFTGRDKVNELRPTTVQSAAAKRDAQQPGQMSQATQRKDPMVHATNRINMNTRTLDEKDIGKHNNATTGFDALVKKLTPKYGKAIATKIAGKQASKIGEAEMPTHDGDMGAGLGAGRSQQFEGKKPDFLDLDKDGNKKESMKKAAQDKKKVKESMNENLLAARLKGKHDGIKGHSHCGKNYQDMEEARCYHEGYKEGLDECYGQMPIQGMVGEMGNEVENMASYGARTPELDEVSRGDWIKQQASKPGDTFKAFGQTMHDSDVLDEFAFEALDNQLNALLESKEEVAEGMTVSISKGQQGAPDSVSVSAQDGEADQLLSIIKSAGLGLFGGEEPSGYGAPQGGNAHGGIEVVDDHDGMMALMKKLAGGGEEVATGDFEDEEGPEEHGHEEGHEHTDEEACNECGMAYESCGCDHGDKEVVDEVESEDQQLYNVAEDNPPDSGAADTDADDASEAGEDAALAKDDAAADEEEAKIYSSPTNESEDETGEEAGKEEKKEMSESSFFNLYKKLAMLSEESTSEKDDKAEKAAKKVAKDIEYDEGHKGKDDDKAEEAGKKVKKDIEYDDKKDKKEKIDEWANEAGKKGTDASFEADIDFMMNIISGGLNKRKQTGQTTIPVVSTQLNRMVSQGTTDINESKMLNESVSDWKKLAGI